jgi:hypothetical protein
MGLCKKSGLCKKVFAACGGRIFLNFNLAQSAEKILFTQPHFL